MNEYQEALDKLKTHCLSSPSLQNGEENGFGPDYDMYHDCYEDETQLLQELVDKATPKKPIKLEIIDLDEIIMPEYTNTIDKYMCDNCGLTWFIVDGHTYQHKYCKQCGQAIDWSDDPNANRR